MVESEHEYDPKKVITSKKLKPLIIEVKFWKTSYLNIWEISGRDIYVGNHEFEGVREFTFRIKLRFECR